MLQGDLLQEMGEKNLLFMGRQLCSIRDMTNDLSSTTADSILRAHTCNNTNVRTNSIQKRLPEKQPNCGSYRNLISQPYLKLKLFWVPP